MITLNKCIINVSVSITVLYSSAAGYKTCTENADRILSFRVRREASKVLRNNNWWTSFSARFSFKM